MTCNTVSLLLQSKFNIVSILGIRCTKNNHDLAKEERDLIGYGHFTTCHRHSGWHIQPPSDAVISALCIFDHPILFFYTFHYS